MQAGSGGGNKEAYDQAMKDETEAGEARHRERAEQKEAEKKKEGLDEYYKKNDKEEKFPVTAREADGEGLEVTEKIPSVIPDPAPASNPAPEFASASAGS